MSISKKISLFVIFFVLFSFVFTVNSEQTGPDSSEDNYISIDFNNVDLNVFIKFISELTGKNFIVDKNINGKVTVISPTKISVKEAYKVFESVLEVHGFTAVDTGAITKIIPLNQAKGRYVDTRVYRATDEEQIEDTLATRIVPLKFADSSQMINLLKPMASRHGIINSYNDTNMLIITDMLSNIERLLKIINTVDINNVGKKISVIPIEYADAKKLARNIENIFRKDSLGKSRDSKTNIVADERTNYIILMASELKTKQIKELISFLDKKVPKGKEKIRVYYLEHASAENIVKILQTIPENNKGSDKKNSPFVSEQVKITADESTNSLVIMADKEDYPVLEKVIAKLDIPRTMVYIECLIMEVNVDNDLNIGTEWVVGKEFKNTFNQPQASSNQGAYIGGFGGNDYSNVTNLGQGGLPGGFSMGVMTPPLLIGDKTFPSLGGIIQAYKTDKNIHILATPQILTTDNEEASIVVGKNVPYQTRSSISDNSSTVYNSYEYKDVGITLKITPQISKDNLIKLKVFQQITKMDIASKTSEERPTTLKRKIDTTLIVKDGNTAVIGGLIDKNLSDTENKMPCLGDIPVLGYLFKTDSYGEEKTNLYVFLTPRVIHNFEEADTIYKSKKKHIDRVKRENSVRGGKYVNKIKKEKTINRIKEKTIRERSIRENSIELYK